MHVYLTAILLTIAALLQAGCDDNNRQTDTHPLQEQTAPHGTPLPSDPAQPEAAVPDQHDLDEIIQENLPTDVVEKAQDMLGDLDQQKDQAMNQLNQPAREVESQTLAVEQAQSLLDQVRQYLSEHKMDLAQKGLRQLEQMAPSLPQPLQEKITEVQNLYKTVKATFEAQKGIPSLPSK